MIEINSDEMVKGIIGVIVARFKKLLLSLKGNTLEFSKEDLYLSNKSLIDKIINYVYDSLDFIGISDLLEECSEDYGWYLSNIYGVYFEIIGGYSSIFIESRIDFDHVSYFDYIELDLVELDIAKEYFLDCMHESDIDNMLYENSLNIIRFKLFDGGRLMNSVDKDKLIYLSVLIGDVVGLKTIAIDIEDNSFYGLFSDDILYYDVAPDKGECFSLMKDKWCSGIKLLIELEKLGYGRV